jgi:tRNA modification GTPase
LIGLLGDLEAGLDFVDEDIEFVSRVEISERLDRAWHTVHDLAQRARKQLPAGYRPRVVLAGLPNAGKSTLFNRLLAADRAIVSPVAGTTRDYVSAVLPLEGSLIELIDTAGWETPNDAIMQQAQSRQLEQMQAADLVLWCQGADLSTADEAMNRDGRRYAEHHAAHVLTVTTRSDLGISAQAPGKESSAGLRVSAVTGAGLDALASVLTEKLFRADGGRSELLGTTSARCRDSLDRAATALASARDAVRLQAGDELLSLDLRTALNELAVILGEVCTDDILDHIFSRFCIGK